jgi:hypothetical protein
VARATPCPKNGVAGPPHFWPKGGRSPHTGRIGVASATPRPLGVVRPPSARGGRSHHQALGGGPATPKIPNPFSQFFFFLVAFRGGRTTPKGLGVAEATPYRPYGGGFGHPLAKNVVVRPPHFLGKGWLQPPRFLPFFFFLFKTA